LVIGKFSHLTYEDIFICIFLLQNPKKDEKSLPFSDLNMPKFNPFRIA